MHTAFATARVASAPLPPAREVAGLPCKFPPPPFLFTWIVVPPEGMTALSQILVCPRCETSVALSGEVLRGQGVELFSRTEACLTVSCKLPFAQHVHELDAGE